MFSSDASARALVKGVAISVVVHVFAGWGLGRFANSESATATLRPIVAMETDARIAAGAEADDESVMGVERRASVGEASGPIEEYPDRLAAALRGDDTSKSPEETETPDRTPRSEAHPVPADAPPENEKSRAEAREGAGETDLSDAEAQLRRSANSATFPTLERDGGEKAGDGRSSKGGISLARIEAIIRSHHEEVIECFASRRDYIAVGRKLVATEFWLGTDGHATRVETLHRTTNSAVARCVHDRILEWTFPELDEPVRFEKTFVFHADIKAKWVHPRRRFFAE